MKKRLSLMFLPLILTTIVVGSWALLMAKEYPVLLGLTLLAYGFGLRHAVDLDHLAAIDNTTRKLMHDGQKPVAVGFFFALGHSSIVTLLCALIALSTTFVNEHLASFQKTGAVIGTVVSSFFLIVIGIINLIVLMDLIREKKPARFFRPLLKIITKSWQMYFVGLLFGLGFDTATEIGLLTLSAASAAKGMPLGNIMILPLAFTAGMTLIDTLDGVLMLRAYDWASLNPLRRRSYNIAITLASVALAIVLGIHPLTF